MFIYIHINIRENRKSSQELTKYRDTGKHWTQDTEKDKRYKKHNTEYYKDQ